MDKHIYIYWGWGLEIGDDDIGLGLGSGIRTLGVLDWRLGLETGITGLDLDLRILDC